MIPVSRPYQLDLIERVYQARARGARIIVVQASTGAGKTHVACAIARRAVAKDKRVLFTVHRRKLVDQISSTLREFEILHGVIMRGEHAYQSAPVQVASRDTIASRYIDREWHEMPPADLVIVDEAHLASKPDSEHRRLLEHYPRATILLLSATPVGPDGKGLGPWANAIECSLPTSQLVSQGFLVPVKCYAPDREKSKGKLRRGVAGDLVSSWEMYADKKATVLFTSRVAHSQEAVKAFAKAGYKFKHLDANTPDEEREQAFADLKRGIIHGISNCGIVGIGVDVPEFTVCQIFRNLDSRVAFLQACGRIMRPCSGKKNGILIDHSGAVFRCGFPDEDTEWSLEGNADTDFHNKHEAGKTKKPLYCSECELVYSGHLQCPQCGRAPSKKPASYWAKPVEHTNEVLTEAERGQLQDYEETGPSRKAQIGFWYACLATQAKRKNGNFGGAFVMFQRKFGFGPPADFPYTASFAERKMGIREKYPDFGKRAQHAE